MCAYSTINYCIFCAVYPTYIIYSEENGEAVHELSAFLMNKCGVVCDIDQYHAKENITQWDVWNEEKIRETSKCNGFVLLVCSPEMYQQLSNSAGSQIQMKVGHISTLTLNSLIRDDITTYCIIPVCLEKLNKEVVPASLRGRTIYHLSFSTLIRVDSRADIESILDKKEFESLRSLVYKLRGISEVYKPILGN